MQIELRGGNTFVSGKERDIIERQTRALEDCAAEMTKGVGMELWKVELLPEMINHIVERSNTQGEPRVPMRFGKKEWAAHLSTKSFQNLTAVCLDVALEEPFC